MKKNFSNFLVFWVLSANVGAMTFEQALRTAESQSIDLRRALLAAEIAQADARVADYEDSLKATFNASVADYRPKDRQTIAALANKDRVASFTLSRSVLDFGRHTARMQQVTGTKEVKDLSAEELHDSLNYRLSRAYSLVAVTGALKTLAEGQVRVAEGRLKQQAANYRHGLRTESDWIAAQVDLGKAQIMLKKAMDDDLLNRLALARLLGMSRQEIAEASFPFPADSSTYAAKLADRVRSWNSFLPTTTVRRLQREQLALTAERDLMIASKRPTLGLALVAQKAGPRDGEWNDRYTGQLTLNWDLPWTGQSREEEQRITLRQQDVKLAIEGETQDRSDKALNANQVFSAAESQFRALGEQQQLTKRLLLLVKQRYESGKASALEVAAAESDHINNTLEQIRQLGVMIVAAIDSSEAKGEKDVGQFFSSTMGWGQD
ncbi:MAG: TolC family protein [Pseudomonadota bacterium]